MATKTRKLAYDHLVQLLLVSIARENNFIQSEQVVVRSLMLVTKGIILGVVAQMLVSLYHFLIFNFPVATQPGISLNDNVCIWVTKFTSIGHMSRNLVIFSTQLNFTAFFKIRTLKYKKLNKSLEVSINWNQLGFRTITETTFPILFHTTI